MTAERHSSKAALHLARLGLEMLEKHGRKPEFAVDAFISIVRANMDAGWLTYREAAERLGSNIEAVCQRAIRFRWPRIFEGAFRNGSDWASQKGNEGALIKALEAHVETLKAQLAAAEARIDKQVAAGLAAERAKVEAEKARADKAIEAIVSLADRFAPLADRFARLQDRLNALATERSRPWWRRIAG
jgi:hypothetical protein